MGRFKWLPVVPLLRGCFSGSRYHTGLLALPNADLFGHHMDRTRCPPKTVCPFVSIVCSSCQSFLLLVDTPIIFPPWPTPSCVFWSPFVLFICSSWFRMIARRRVYSCAQPIFYFLPAHCLGPSQSVAHIANTVPGLRWKAKTSGQGWRKDEYEAKSDLEGQNISLAFCLSQMSSAP